MFCNFSGMSGLHNYARAKAYFEKTEWPRNKTRGDYIWGDHERPLDGVRKHHVRIVRRVINGEETFGLWLYRTEMVRYCPPGADGFARVLIHTDVRNASSQFMWRSGWSTTAIRRYDPARGCDVCIPLTRNEHRNGGYWSADLWLRNDTIDVSRSWHVPMAKQATSLERKRERRNLLKPVEHILNFAVQTADHQWRAKKFLNEHTLRCALAGDVDAQAYLMEWAVSQNTAAVSTLKNALLRQLRLPTRDSKVPLPVFSLDADLPRNVKRLVSAD